MFRIFHINHNKLKEEKREVYWTVTLLFNEVKEEKSNVENYYFIDPDSVFFSVSKPSSNMDWLMCADQEVLTHLESDWNIKLSDLTEHLKSNNKFSAHKNLCDRYKLF